MPALYASPSDLTTVNMDLSLQTSSLRNLFSPWFSSFSLLTCPGLLFPLDNSASHDLIPSSAKLPNSDPRLQVYDACSSQLVCS